MKKKSKKVVQPAPAPKTANNFATVLTAIAVVAMVGLAVYAAILPVKDQSGSK